MIVDRSRDFTPGVVYMSRPDPVHAREFAVQVVRKLREAGFESLWAGGCVRDQLMGARTKRLRHRHQRDSRPDSRGVWPATHAGRGRFVRRHHRHRSAGSRSDRCGDVPPDAGYSDGRHPDAVTFSTAEEDAQRRDFTINGLYLRSARAARDRLCRRPGRPAAES